MALDEIIAYKQALVEKKKEEILSYRYRVQPADKSLLQTLEQSRCSFILEIKFASPSKGVIKKNISVGEIVKIYEPFADAISVLADEKFFKGSLDYVKQVSAIQSHPVLAKDVVVSPLQVYESRFYGAHAVLLMLSVLNDEMFHLCAQAASELKMDFICEVHTKEEMLRANRLGAKIIGINNRNLKTLKIDLDTFEKLFPYAPSDAKVIMESGISSRSQIQKYGSLVDGFLIGSSLMSAERIDLTLRELLFGRVKICGLTNHEDAMLAYQSGAYYGGLNFYPLSKRRINADEGLLIKKNVPLIWGGVFVNQVISEINEAVRKLSLDFVQLHGDEDENFIQELQKYLPANCKIWKAFGIKESLNVVAQLKVDRILLDNFHKEQYGGTGKSFDWEILRNTRQRHDYIIAGGINKDNILSIDSLEPFAIDIASGVENDDPRKKSARKIKEIFSQLRSGDNYGT
jgi:indole-3-glycerol phosphate synthase / phosphoribosylanthranilate isomerase